MENSTRMEPVVCEKSFLDQRDFVQDRHGSWASHVIKHRTAVDPFLDQERLNRRRIVVVNVLIILEAGHDIGGHVLRSEKLDLAPEASAC